MEKLGVGIGLTPKKFTPDRVERALRRLLGEKQGEVAAEVVREWMPQSGEVGELVD